MDNTKIIVTFVAIMLKYQYAPFVTGMVILMAIPAALAMLYARFSPFGTAFILCCAIYLLARYFHHIAIGNNSVTIGGLWKKEQIPYKEIKNVLIRKDTFFGSSAMTIIQINTLDHQRRTIHCGILPYERNVNALRKLLKEKHIETICPSFKDPN